VYFYVVIIFENMATKYSSAERSSLEVMKEQYSDVISEIHIQELLQALPYIAAILNENRQIIFANDPLLQLMEVDCPDAYLGKKPGEVLSCIHSSDSPDGCGIAESCKMCGAINTILVSKRNNKKTIGECRISALKDGKAVSYDLQVAATPLKIKTQSYTLLTVNDISSDKRKRILEQIFFHDLLNTSSNISAIVNLLKSTGNLDEMHKFIDVVSDLSHQLNEEIIMQRDLLAAENNELKVNMALIQTKLLIDMAIHSILNNQVASGKKIITSEQTENFLITTDNVIINRVLVNMLKNALEASPDVSDVQIGCGMVEMECLFWVKNEEFIKRTSNYRYFNAHFRPKVMDGESVRIV
jgi:hypothetical protein